MKYRDAQLVQYSVAYQPDGKHFREVTAPQVYETPYRSPQLPLWQFGDDEWLKILRLPQVSKRKARAQPAAAPERLFASFWNDRRPDGGRLNNAGGSKDHLMRARWNGWNRLPH